MLLVCRNGRQLRWTLILFIYFGKWFVLGVSRKNPWALVVISWLLAEHCPDPCKAFCAWALLAAWGIWNFPLEQVSVSWWECLLCWGSSLLRAVGVSGREPGAELGWLCVDALLMAPTYSPVPVCQRGIRLVINWLTEGCYLLPLLLLNSNMSSRLLSGQGMKWWGCRFLPEVQQKVDGKKVNEGKNVT